MKNCKILVVLMGLNVQNNGSCATDLRTSVWLFSCRPSLNTWKRILFGWF